MVIPGHTTNVIDLKKKQVCDDISNFIDDSNEVYHDKKHGVDLKPLGVESSSHLWILSYYGIFVDQIDGKSFRITSISKSKILIDGKKGWKSFL
jgi:hypothetical protein